MFAVSYDRPRMPPRRGTTKTVATRSLEQTLWDAADKMRGNLEAAEYKHVVLGLVFLKYVSDAFEQRRRCLETATADDPNTDYYIPNPAKRDDIVEARDEYTSENVFWVPAEARWELPAGRAKQPEIGTLIDAAMDLIERENPSLKGVLPKTYARAEIDKRLLGELVDLIGNDRLHQTSTTAPTTCSAGSTSTSSAGSPPPRAATPASSTRPARSSGCSSRCSSRIEGRVFDPCCGSGGMFVQSAEFVAAHGGKRDDISIYGQEFDATTWRLAKMNLALSRASRPTSATAPTTAFHRDLHPDLRADFILANPPFNKDDWFCDALRDDPRWEYGLPPAGNANFAWVQHFIYHLAPNGTAGFVLANGSLSYQAGGEGEIRRKLVEADLVDCIVAMPEQAVLQHRHPGLPVVRRQEPGQRQRSPRPRVARCCSSTPASSAAWRPAPCVSSTTRTSRRIAGHVPRLARRRRPAPTTRTSPGFCKAATLDEIAAHDFVLTPGRYVGAAEVEDDGEPIEDEARPAARTAHRGVRGSRPA